MIVDAHCHVWPDALAARLLAARPAGMDAVGDGTVAGLLRTMDAAVIDRACALSIANVPAHVARANEFIGGVDRSRLVPFGTVHTGLSVEENLASLRDNHIAGVKFHPNFQGISLADPALVELFTALAEAGIPVIAHLGEGADSEATERGAARHVPALVDAIPGLVFIACHWGGYHGLDDADILVGSTAYLETSWPPSLSELGVQRVRDLIARHGADRVIFGSDWPMADPAAELGHLRSVGLTADDEAAVLGGNLAGILGLDDSKGVK